jgi:hypothetical protein
MIEFLWGQDQVTMELIHLLKFCDLILIESCKHIGVGTRRPLLLCSSCSLVWCV